MARTESTVHVSLDTARCLAVFKQGLHRRPPEGGRQALLEATRRIGLLQLDTVNVVARSHYLVMLSRVGLYDPADLDALLYPERVLFESWAHAACLIPTEDYVHFVPVLHARRERPLHPWVLDRLGHEAQAVLDAVLAEVRERGPLASREFEDPREQREGWWDWKPAKSALEVLFDRGHLMIDRRESFQRYYDLAERVLPASGEMPASTVEDFLRWATLKGISHLGVATAAQASDYYRLRKPDVRAILATLTGEGAMLPAEVQGWKDPAYLLPEDLPLLDQIEAGEHRPRVTTFLSPFDNLMWDRDRVHDLFGFEYRIEIYTPAARRHYGYYVLPILHNGRLVGRLDPKADRQAGTMIVRAIYLEPGQEPGAELVAGIASALGEFMAFHGSQRLQLGIAEPETLVPLLEEHLAAQDVVLEPLGT